MSNSVDAARRTHALRQRHGEVDIIYHRTRQYLRITLRGLPPLRGLTKDRRHLAAGVRRWDRDMVQARPNTDRLAQARRTATTKADHAVCTAVLRVPQCLVRNMRRRMHGSITEEAGGSDTSILKDGL